MSVVLGIRIKDKHGASERSNKLYFLTQRDEQEFDFKNEIAEELLFVAGC
jgi:hypothetical protein